jgi:hypothetical protein
MKSTQSVTTSYEWLMGRDKHGERRIETLTWKRLGSIYRAIKPGSPARKAINAECRRLGYTPRMILGINR